MEYIYMDNAATTKVDPRVKEIMNKYLDDEYANPSSIHTMGNRGTEALEEAREKVASLIGAEAEEIVFTSGGTESDNLAIKGAVWKNPGDHIITSCLEHPAVLKTCEYLEENGYDVTYLDVDEHGLVDLEEFEESIREDTVLASIMYANNEIGTIEPIEELVKIAHEHDVLFHTDAVQAVGKTHIDVKEEDIDLFSLSGHKIHAAKGVGALYIKDGVDMEPLQHGGAHEFGLRAGTENVPGIVGLGEACSIAEEEMDDYIPEMKRLRDKLIKGIDKNIEKSYLNGHPTERLVNNVNFSFEAVEGESILLQMDSQGIEASTGSACSSKKLEPSQAILALGRDEELAHSSIRLTIGKYTKEEHVDKVLEVLPEIISNLRAMSPLWEGN